MLDQPIYTVIRCAYDNKDIAFIRIMIVLQVKILQLLLLLLLLLTVMRMMMRRRKRMLLMVMVIMMMITLVMMTRRRRRSRRVGEGWRCLGNKDQ